VVALKEIGNKVRFVGDAIAASPAPRCTRCATRSRRSAPTYEAEEHNVDYLQLPEARRCSTATARSTTPWPETPTSTQALAAGKATHDGTYRTEVQTHSSLETHGGVAKWNGKDLEVWNSDAGDVRRPRRTRARAEGKRASTSNR
jgi:xanthine dehydrogenase YagR molybdenum-binding subunit